MTSNLTMYYTTLCKNEFVFRLWGLPTFSFLLSPFSNSHEFESHSPSCFQLSKRLLSHHGHWVSLHSSWPGGGREALAQPGCWEAARHWQRLHKGPWQWIQGGLPHLWVRSQLSAPKLPMGFHYLITTKSEFFQWPSRSSVMSMQFIFLV